jgi:hypothetical protein
LSTQVSGRISGIRPLPDIRNFCKNPSENDNGSGSLQEKIQLIRRIPSTVYSSKFDMCTSKGTCTVLKYNTIPIYCRADLSFSQPRAQDPVPGETASSTLTTRALNSSRAGVYACMLILDTGINVVFSLFTVKNNESAPAFIFTCCYGFCIFISGTITQHLNAVLMV